MIWALEVYDTEMRVARSRRYTSSEITAIAWERIPRIDFTDSGHGLVFQSHKHSGKRQEVNPYGYSKRTAELPTLKRAVRAERKQLDVATSQLDEFGGGVAYTGPGEDWRKAWISTHLTDDDEVIYELVKNDGSYSVFYTRAGEAAKAAIGLERKNDE